MNRIRYLDGLRGLLASIVFLHHYLYTFAPELLFGGDYDDYLHDAGMTLNKCIALSPLNIIFNPSAAITFFFLLSGFVQSYNYFTKPELKFLQRSFLKRYFRLALPALAVVMLVFVFHRLNFINKAAIPSNELTGQWILNLFPDNLSFAQAVKHGLYDCFTGISQYYPVLWTLSRELISSWLVLLILFVTHNVSSRRYLIFAWLMVQIFVLNSLNAAAFTIGMLICEMHLQRPRFGKFLSSRVVRLNFFLAGIYLASLPFTAYEGALEKTIYSPLLLIDNTHRLGTYVAGSALLLCWMLYSPRVQSALTSKPLLLLGDISFMVYLLHLLLIFSVSPFVLKHLFPRMDSAALIITGLITYITTIVFSFLMFKLVDKPVLKYCNRYISALVEKR